MFAQAALDAIVAAGHQVVLVLTRIDKSAGRGQLVQFSPVKQAAIEHSIELFQPVSLRDPAIVQVLANKNPDVMVVAAYGRILPLEVLRLPPYGCINIHASLLPRWRGAAPIQRAIEAGDQRSGISIMQMDEGLDTGDILMTESLEIGPEDPAGIVHDRLMALGASAIVCALSRLERGVLIPKPQPEQGVTYARKIEKSEMSIDWELPAEQLHNKIRAFDPFPGCTTRRQAGAREVLKIWRARVLSAAQSSKPGTLLAVEERQFVVQCGGHSRLAVLELQRPGGKRLPAGEFLKGLRLAVGECFDY